MNSSKDLVKSAMEEDQGVLGASQVQGEDFWVPGTAGTAWRHPIGRQAPCHRGVWVLFTKNDVFRTFRAKGIVGRYFSPARRHILTSGR